MAVAGDTVYVKKGIYNNRVTINRSGDLDDYIVFSAYPGDEEQVILDNAGILLDEASYVRVSGFYIRNTVNGIGVRGLSDGVILSGNHTFDTFGSGISVWGVDWGEDPSEMDYDYIRDIVIENNKIEKACNGGWNECITLANGVNGFKILNNEIFNGGDPVNGGEGIDIKEGCWDGLISGNIIHGLTRRGIYLDGGGHMDEWETPDVQNIYVTKNRVYSNSGCGFAIMTEGTAEVHDVFVYNNLFYDNAEDGVMFYRHPAGTGNVYNIYVVNNTCYKNSRFGILLNFATAENIVVRNNICYKNNSGNIYMQNGEYVKSNNLTKNPLVVHPETGDFHLTADSPAIDAGTDVDAPTDDFDGNARPFGAGFDIGACEYIGSAGVDQCRSDAVQPDKTALSPSYPNPFNAQTIITFKLSERSDVQIAVYDPMGRQVHVWATQSYDAGSHRLVWDARNQFGLPVASGLYFIKMSAKGKIETNTVLLIK